MERPKRYGGIVHQYQKYDPINLPSPTQPPPDLVSPAFEHSLMFGNYRQLTPEELANAIHLDPSQIQGFGPPLEAIKQMLEERKRKILETYETESVQLEAAKELQVRSKQQKPPKELADRYRKAVMSEQLYDLERLWYAHGNDHSLFAHHLLRLIQTMGDKYQVDELASKYDFSGQQSMSIPEALEIKEELEKIDELLEQLEEALKNATIGIIDMEAMEEFASEQQLQDLKAMQEQIENYVREMAERQGLDLGKDGIFRLTPQAYKTFQGKLLSRIFSDLQASRTGRHAVDVVGDGAVETQRTKSYEFGDSISHMDVSQTVINSLLRSQDKSKVRFRADDIEVHETKNHPKCATVVVMDVSGSTRYDGQYMNIKRMALALDGLIRSEYPGDYLQFVEMASFAKPVPRGEIVELLPKPVTIHDPVVQLKVDMSRPDVSEMLIPPHFTNIQHGLQQARQYLSSKDTPNRQVIVITDGLPTAHFEENWLYLLYPPHERTEDATFREAMLCKREGITINMFLVPSWSQSEEDVQFAHRLAETTQGRVIFTAGNDLDRFVIWDYISHRKEILG